MMILAPIVSINAQNTYSEEEEEVSQLLLGISPGHDDIYEEDEEQFEINAPPTWRSQGTRGRIPVNVDSFGAIGDGAADDTEVMVIATQYISFVL